MTTQTSQTTGQQSLLAKATEAYGQHSRASQEDQWILDNLPLVRHVVQKVVFQLSQKQDVDDLISAGTLGLVKAARMYDPTRDAKFRTYAYIRIRGAIIDELRSRSFVPANVYKQVRQAQQAYQRHCSAHGRPPTDEQLASELGVSEAQLYRTLEEARKQSFLSIHGLSEGQPALGAIVPQAQGPSPDEQIERKEVLEKLAECIAEMPERGRLVLLLYYERDLTMKESAAVLGITEGRFSQLHAAALFKLAMRLRTAQ